MHVGTAQSALFNWLFARHHGGKFFVRIEDTDKARSTKEYETSIIEGLQWLGLQWDNPELIRQSERSDMYRAELQRLLDSGKAVWRTYTTEEKAAMEKEGRAARDQVIVLVDNGDPERELVFDDMIRGPVSVLAKNVGQLVIAKSLDEPLYHFAVVVDDIAMEITHVLRGEDHISNTPKQMLIYEALGAPMPRFAHLPLMLAADRSKLSKRNGKVSMSEYQADYLPEAMLSFLGSLSYTFDAELLTKEEMVAQFDLTKVHKSGAVFDVQKLNWTNAQYVRRLSPEAFRKVTGMHHIPDEAIPLITERLEKLSDVGQFSYLWSDVHSHAADLCYTHQTPDDAARALSLCLVLFDGGVLTKDQLDTLAAEQFDGQKGRVYWPLRVALSGLRASAAPLDIIAAIGEAQARARIEHAIAALQP
jgi:glutamyl/glutaminyl-tRNA synthetase